MADLARPYDVLVVGGGNAALCAALTARRARRAVLVARSRAPKAFRGGNSRHTRNLRCMHDAPTDVLTDAYPRGRVLATTCCG